MVLKTKKVLDRIRAEVKASSNPVRTIQEIRSLLHSLSPQAAQPVDLVLWVPLEMVTPNDYNPNRVAKIEMRLLYTSIDHDGYMQPCVTIWDPEQQKYVIVDGFHRYYVMRVNRDVYDACHGMLPIVVIDKDANDRMASTIRHNRARGKHSIQGMSNMVFMLLDKGWTDEEICNELGMGPEEILRLKHITGFSKLFKDTEYRKAWMTERQIRIGKDYRAKHGSPGETAGSPSQTS